MRRRIWVLLLLVFTVAGVHTKQRRKSPIYSVPPLHSFAPSEPSREVRAAWDRWRHRPPNFKRSVNHTILNYMWELFKFRNRLIGKSNMIRSFHAEVAASSMDVCDPNKVHYSFDLSTIPSDEEIWSAELVLHRERVVTSKGERSPVIRVQVFDIIRPGGTNSIQRLLDTHIFQGKRKSGWESFDVLPAIQRWMAEPSENYGFNVELVSSDKLSQTQHVRLKRSANEDDERWTMFKPLLVIYSKDPAMVRYAQTRTKRSPRKHRRKGRKDNCRRHALYVDFSDVNWNDWIIAPPGYNSHYCYGDCPYPLPDHLNTTNHAIVQTLVNSANPAAVPRACCVPTELSPISMLYIDEYDDVVLKNYQDMVVEGCGCR